MFHRMKDDRATRTGSSLHSFRGEARRFCISRSSGCWSDRLRSWEASWVFAEHGPPLFLNVTARLFQSRIELKHEAVCAEQIGLKLGVLGD